MATAAHHPASDLDPFSERVMSDPFRYHAEKRAAGPVVWLERYGIWAISHYAEVFSAVTDAKTFISSAGVGIADLPRDAASTTEHRAGSRSAAAYAKAVGEAARAYATKVFADTLRLPQMNREVLLPYGTMVFNNTLRAYERIPLRLER